MLREAHQRGIQIGRAKDLVLAGIQRIMHRPELTLRSGGFGRLGGNQRVRMGADEREMPEHECETVAQLGPSPGFRDLEWLKPVHVGDTISYATEVVEMRPLESRPGWGMIVVRNTGVNQRGEAVISFVSSAFVERRERQSQAS